MGGFGLLDLVMTGIFIVTGAFVGAALRPSLGLGGALLVGLIAGWVNMMAWAALLGGLDRWLGRIARRDHEDKDKP